MRRISYELFYVLRSGCAWRYLPREYGPWQIGLLLPPALASRWHVGAHPANIPDREGGEQVLEAMGEAFPRFAYTASGPIKGTAAPSSPGQRSRMG